MSVAGRSKMLFIGVTTGASLVVDVFPAWCEELGIEGAILEGVDLPLGAPPAAYREVIDRLARDEAQLGALVTTHKLDLFAACRSRFAEVDEFAGLMHEASSIAKGPAGLIARARDPLTSERALRAFVPADHWDGGEAEVLVLGAGGAATAIAWTLRDAPAESAPRRVTVTDVDAGRLAALERVLGAAPSQVPFRAVRVDADGGNDRLAAALPAGSLVINATGLGKDRPGSPLCDASAFPPAALAWELNYRGALDFVAQAERAGAVVEDGFRYFVHGWIEVIGDVFDVEVPTAGPAFERLEGIARVALDARNGKNLAAATPREE
ncbi:MAG: shikimate dehydrogenase [Actinobacteria bacterium]|nr:shikimate dehydrogenase [Actinomycetota bacterium]